MAPYNVELSSNQPKRSYDLFGEKALPRSGSLDTDPWCSVQEKEKEKKNLWVQPFIFCAKVCAKTFPR
jgi:hypothetical protein